MGCGEAVENRKKLLTEHGYSYSEVQNMVNQILNGSAVTPSNTKQDQNQSISKKVVATCSAKQFNKVYTGEYKTQRLFIAVMMPEQIRRLFVKFRLALRLSAMATTQWQTELSGCTSSLYSMEFSTQDSHPVRT